jgi:hypothetical protein
VTVRGTLKTRLAVAAALLVTLFVGRLWGASGRWELERALSAAAVRVDLLEAQASLLGARISLGNADFGEMSQRMEDARRFVGRAGARIGDAGLDDEFLRLDLAGFGAGIDEAQRLAARFTRGADGASRVHGPALPVKTSEKP